MAPSLLSAFAACNASACLPMSSGSRRQKRPLRTARAGTAGGFHPGTAMPIGWPRLLVSCCMSISLFALNAGFAFARYAEEPREILLVQNRIRAGPSIAVEEISDLLLFPDV